MKATETSYSPNESFRVTATAAVEGSDGKKYFTCEDKSSYVRVEDIDIKGKPYTIQSGDSLSAIANAKYDHNGQEYYMKIYNANPDVLTAGPDHIRAGVSILIPE